MEKCLTKFAMNLQWLILLDRKYSYDKFKRKKIIKNELNII